MVLTEGNDPSSLDYQSSALPLSYASKFWCRYQESNLGHMDFQSTALPPELYRHWGDGWGLNPYYCVHSTVCRPLHYQLHKNYGLCETPLYHLFFKNLAACLSWIYAATAGLPCSHRYHIETHSFTAATLEVLPLHRLSVSARSLSVFLYGRGTENRTLIYWLKASYFSR